MSILELARQAYARIKAEQNGCAGAIPAIDSGPTNTVHGYEENEGSTKKAPYCYQLVKDRAHARSARSFLSHCSRIGLDVETTGLNPRQDRVRLLQLADDAPLTTVFVFDLFALPATALAPLWKVVRRKELVAHNAAFDLGFLAQLGWTPLKTRPVHDTMLLAQLLAAGTGEKCSLAACVERHLGRTLDKAEQKSDWSGELTAEQLDYAANDAAVLLLLYEALAKKIKGAHLEQAADIERRCLPAVTWMRAQGIGFNAKSWQSLAATAGLRAGMLEIKLRGMAPATPNPNGQPWNIASNKQTAAVLQSLDIDLPRTAKGNPSVADEALSAIDHPLAQRLRQYRAVRQCLNTYGPKWLQFVHDGRLYADWRQIGAKSGRMSCRQPNLQNPPRDPAYRRCFSAPPGRVLVKADYSQIELRVAAAITGDAAMLAAFQRGDDLHTLTARTLTGRDQITPEERQRAKVSNFGTLYGLSTGGLIRKARKEYGIDLPEADAKKYRDAFFTAYPKVAVWHRWLKSHAKEVRTIQARRVLIDPAADWFGRRAAWIVSGSAADGIKQAMALLWERRAEVPGAFPVLAVHDEIVVECDEGQADAVAKWLKQAMFDGMQPLIDPVPVVVETQIGRTWAGEGKETDAILRA